jgi:malate synthase
LAADGQPELPGFRADTRDVRSSSWSVAAVSDAGSNPDYEVSGLEGFGAAQRWSQRLRESSALTSRALASIRVNVAIDTLTSTFEAEEILYALRDFAVVIKASPTGFLFSYIKKFAEFPEFVLPDRAHLTIATPCLNAYAQHLSGIADRRQAAVLDLPECDADKLFWQSGRIEAADLLQVPKGRITEDGVRENIRIALKRMAGDTTISLIDAEFARAQLWQWVRHVTGVLDSGLIIDERLFESWLDEEAELLAAAWAAGDGADTARLREAARVLSELSKAATISPFLDDQSYRIAN